MIYDFASAVTDGTFVTPSSVPFGLTDVGGFQVDLPESPDFAYVYNIVAEMFNKSATDVYLHERTRNTDIIETHDEDADPTYHTKRAMRAYFQPQPMEYQLKPWGLDLDNKMDVVFLRASLLETVGQRLLKPGDLIEVTYRSAGDQRPTYYRISNAQEFGNYRYQWLYVKASAELIAGDITIRPPTAPPIAYNDFPAGL